MNIHIGLLGLIVFLSATAFGQNPAQRNPSSLSPFDDPFDVMEKWPDSSFPTRQKDHGPAQTVSLRDLEHKVPKPALNEYKKSAEAFKKDDSLLAKQHLEKALEIDPRFADAHNDLGVAFARLGQMDHATAEFQRAIELSQQNSAASANLSVALYVKGEYHEASLTARQALRANPGLPQASYVLGLSLIAEHGDTNETIASLERAASQYPESHIIAADILTKAGRRDEAVWHLKEYLRSAPANDPRKLGLEARLAELQH
ncbi:MAG TPA: tetratricopeptide repeat protein [Bryobacteraceae bacterium]|nr:tetratricopeptide repeat protein [Bryobacteraceae bacterium]